MSQSQNGVIKGALALSVSAIMVKIFGVIYKIPLSYILGDEGMGYFNSAYSIYALFYVICTAGVPKAIAVLITEARAGKGIATEGEIYNTSVRLFKYIGFSITLLFILLTPLSQYVLGTKKGVASLLLIAPSILFTSVSGVLRGFLTGKLRLFPIAVSQLIEAALKMGLGLLLAFIGVKLNQPIEIVSAMSIFGITLGTVVCLVFLHICCNLLVSEEKPRQSNRISDYKIAKKVFSISVPISLGSSFLSLSALIDVGLITSGLSFLGYTTEQAVSLYGNYSTLPLPMINLISGIISPISVAALPVMASAFVNNNKEKLSDSLNKTLAITVALSAPPCVIYFLYSFDILDILFDSSSSVIGAEPLTILSIALLILNILTVVNTYHEATKRVSVSVKSLLIGCISKGLLGYILIVACGMGINGAAYATIFSYVLALIYSVSKIRRGEVKFSYLKTTLFFVLLSVIAYLIPYVLLYKSGAFGNNIVSFSALIIMSSILYLALVFAFRYKNCLHLN